MIEREDINEVLIKALSERDTESTERLYVSVHGVASEIFARIQGHLVGGARKEYSDNEELFCDFIYEWNIFSYKEVPFGYWSDLAEEGLSLLHEMAAARNLNYKANPRFVPFIQRVAERVGKLMTTPGVGHLFNELMD